MQVKHEFGGGIGLDATPQIVPSPYKHVLSHAAAAAAQAAAASAANSPATTFRTLRFDNLTDSSAASTPTYHSRSLSSEHDLEPLTGGTANSVPSSPQMATLGFKAHHTLPLPPFDSHSPRSDRISSPQSRTAASSGYAPVRRTKDKQKHSESENRRRQRLRAKFAALQDATGPAAAGAKTDRFSILGSATEKIQELDAKLARCEQEKAALAAQLAQASWSWSLGGGGNTTGGATSTPALSTPLGHYQNMTSFAACYISLDGRILDANKKFTTLFEFEQATAEGGGMGNNNSNNAAASQPAAAAASENNSAAAAAADAAASVSAGFNPTNSTMATPAAGSAPPIDLYSSSIFAVTSASELLHTLSILRNLLCDLNDSFSCPKQCVTVRGHVIDCQMNIASVTNKGKIVMFLCVFVPLKQSTSRPPSHNGNATTLAQGERTASVPPLPHFQQQQHHHQQQQFQQQQQSPNHNFYPAPLYGHTSNDLTHLPHPHPRHLTSPHSNPAGSPSHEYGFRDRSMSLPLTVGLTRGSHARHSSGLHMSSMNQFQQAMSHIHEMDEQLQRQQQALEERMIDRSPETLENAEALSSLHHKFQTPNAGNGASMDQSNNGEDKVESGDRRPDALRLLSVSSLSSQPLLGDSSHNGGAAAFMSDQAPIDRPLSPEPHVLALAEGGGETNSSGLAQLHHHIPRQSPPQPHTIPDLGRPLSNFTDFQRTPSIPISSATVASSFHPNSSPIFQLRESPPL